MSLGADSAERLLLIYAKQDVHARIQKVLLEGFHPDNFFLIFFFIRGERIQIPLEADHYRPTSETPFKRRFAGGPMMAQ